MTSDSTDKTSGTVFDAAEWYDCSINWSARLARELPVLTEVFGPPRSGGLIDAGCGTGRQACALTRRGYRVTGIDASKEMLGVAQRVAGDAPERLEFRCMPYVALFECLGGGFDGVYCLANALAAAGSRDAAGEALTQFARCLRRGGRLFVQILNFAPMRSEQPCVRGPRVARVDDREYISVRHFHFQADHVDITNVTMWHDDGWKQWARTGRLYPIEFGELRDWCHSAGLRIDAEWGGYDRRPFDRETSQDLLLVGTRK